MQLAVDSDRHVAMTTSMTTATLCILDTNSALLELNF